MGNTVIKKSFVGIRDEKEAAGIITPGMLVERTSADKVQAHSIAGGTVNALFAIEDAPQGNTTTDNYASGAWVLLWRPVPGEQVEVIVSEIVAIGDFLESAGNGKLRKLSPVQSSAGVSEYANNVVAVALEAGVADGRVKVEIV